MPRPPTPPPRTEARADARALSTLQIALLVSVGVHAALLTVRFVDPEGFNRMFQDTPLEVILVNSRSGEPPAKAQAIAQVSLAGGGEAVRGALDLAAAGFGRWSRSATPATRRASRSSSCSRAAAAAAVADPARDGAAAAARPQARSGFAAGARARGAAAPADRMLAEIERRVNEENARPKKRYISPATREEVYALYYDSLRRKIEERGTRNFPEYRGRKLYGELVMNMTVDAIGRVIDTEIVRASGSRELDRRAVAIVNAAAPFGAFSPAMRAKADQLVITSRFRFTRDEALETTQSGELR